MKEYLKAQSKTNEIIVGNTVNADELDRFSKSDFRWADNRKKSFQHRPVKKGEIYQFEFGKNFIPEMSYEHRGLVIGVTPVGVYVGIAGIFLFGSLIVGFDIADFRSLILGKPEDRILRLFHYASLRFCQTRS